MAFLILVGRRFMADGCPRIAAGLSYTTILSLAPLLVIAFAMIGAFPAFAGMESQLRALIFEVFVPTAGTAIDEYFTGFSKNAGKLTSIGVITLSVTTLLLLWTIQEAFNQIFKSQQKNSLVFNLLKFWAFVTLGPLLVGASLSFSSLVIATAHKLQIPGVSWIETLYKFGLSTILELIAFFLLFAFLPNTVVRWHHALLGSVVTTVLFRFLKWAFVWYITQFPTYQAIYGALASVPIFLFWVYLSWLAALFGAVLTATLPEWGRIRSAERLFSFWDSNLSPAEKLAYSIKILTLIHDAGREGKLMDTAKLRFCIPIATHQFSELVSLLKEKGYLILIPGGKINLLLDPEEKTLMDLARDLGLILDWQEFSAIVELNLGAEESNLRSVRSLICISNTPFSNMEPNKGDEAYACK